MNLSSELILAWMQYGGLGVHGLTACLLMAGPGLMQRDGRPFTNKNLFYFFQNLQTFIIYSHFKCNKVKGHKFKSQLPKAKIAKSQNLNCFNTSSNLYSMPSLSTFMHSCTFCIGSGYCQPCYIWGREHFLATTKKQFPATLVDLPYLHYMVLSLWETLNLTHVYKIQSIEISFAPGSDTSNVTMNHIHHDDTCIYKNTNVLYLQPQTSHMHQLPHPVTPIPFFASLWRHLFSFQCPCT